MILWCSSLAFKRSCFLYLFLCIQKSRDQGLDDEAFIADGPRSMHSSPNGPVRIQYPPLPMGASTSNGVWPQYPMLARSTSAGGQSDSVFLDAPPDAHSLVPASPGRYSKDPTNPNGSQGDLETDGHNGFYHLHHSLPRRAHGYVQNNGLPGESVVFKTKYKLLNL